eukprot:4446117-Pleurochrysis_carterae.AAC.1
MRLENPVVHPIIAHGRTAAGVQAKLKSYRQKSRQQAAATDDANPIILGDYLLVQLACTSEVALHRVTHGIFIDDKDKSDASFTTLEYTHTPQP